MASLSYPGMARRFGKLGDKAADHLMRILETSEYDNYLLARCKLANPETAAEISKADVDHLAGFIAPKWMDLMMWAVLMGEMGLAWLFWQQVDEPLRAAVVGCRACKQLEENDALSGTDKAQLVENAAVLEGCAVGLLEHTPEEEDAAKLLMLSPKERLRLPKDHVLTRKNSKTRNSIPGSGGGGDPREVEVWGGSVFDEAADEETPCQAFLGHRHCQSLVNNVFVGDYPGSKLKLKGDCSLTLIVLQLFLFITPRPHREGLRRQEPALRRLRQAELRPLRRHRREGEARVAIGRQRRRRRRRRRRVGHGVRRAEGEGEEDQERRLRQAAVLGDLAVQVLGGFISVPKVKFVGHNLFAVLYLFVYILQLLGIPDTPQARMWMYRGTGYLLPGSISALEWVNWFWTLCRVYEESFQITKNGGSYFLDSWNWLDITTYFLILSTAVLRIIMWVDCDEPGLPESFSAYGVKGKAPRTFTTAYYCPTGDGRFGLGAPVSEEWNGYDGMQSRRDGMLIYYSIAYALGAICNFLRLINSCSYWSPSACSRSSSIG